MEKQDNQPVEITFRLPQEGLGELARLLLAALSPQSQAKEEQTVERGENPAFQQELFTKTEQRQEQEKTELMPPTPEENDPALPLPPVPAEQDPAVTRQETVPAIPETEERPMAQEQEKEPLELQSFRDRSTVLPKEEDALRSSGMAADRLSTAYERDARRYDGGFPRY